MKIAIAWLTAGLFTLGVSAGLDEIPEGEIGTHTILVLMFWPVALGEVIASSQFTTIERQDRLSICEGRGE